MIATWPSFPMIGEREAIRGYVACGLTELRQYGIPTAYQDRVELRLDDVPVPVVGFIDWRFDDHGLIVDLKTSERLPSAISLFHARQGAVYARAHGNYGMRFAYVVTAQVRRPGCELAIDFSRRPNRFSIQELNHSRSGKRAVQGRTDRADWGAEG